MAAFSCGPAASPMLAVPICRALFSASLTEASAASEAASSERDVCTLVCICALRSSMAARLMAKSVLAGFSLGRTYFWLVEIWSRSLAMSC